MALAGRLLVLLAVAGLLAATMAEHEVRSDYCNGRAEIIVYSK
jgi:hypothetical protein